MKKQIKNSKKPVRQTITFKSGAPKNDFPLQKLIDLKKKSDEFSRIDKLAKFLEHFHLKYATVSDVKNRKMVLNGKSVINFGSANYLGFDQNEKVIKAAQKALSEWGTHTGSSRTFFTHSNMVELENEISDLLGAEDTMIGHNISQIHAGVIPALFGDSKSVIFIDRHAHTSMYQASLIAKSKGATLIKVDIEKEEELLALFNSQAHSQKVLLIDGIYSMQGHAPNLVHLEKVCKQKNVVLYIDDAHGIGILGDKGGGVVDEFNLSWDNIIVTGSLQKGLGSYGGFLSARKDIVDYLRVTSRAYIFSGTLQPSAVEGAREAIRISKSNEGKKLRKRLKETSLFIRSELKKLNFQVPDGFSPIIPVFIGEEVLTLLAGRKLYDLGIYVNSVLYPAVPSKEGILRISLSTLITDDDIHDLIEAFKKLKLYLSKINKPHKAVFHLSKEVVLSKLMKDDYKGL